MPTNERGNFSQKNKINDLSGKEWMKLSCSILDCNEKEAEHILDNYIKELKTSSYPTRGVNSLAHQIRAAHPSPKPPQLFIELIALLTKEGQTILDPFVGAGSSLIASTLLNRKGIGIDLSPDYKRIYSEAANSLDLLPEKYLIGDSTKESTYQSITEAVDLIICDPPYGDMMSRNKTGTVKFQKGEKPTPFTLLENDIGNVSLNEFFPLLKTAIEKSSQVLKKGGYIVVFMKDIQPKQDYDGLLHADVIRSISQIAGINYRGMKLWFNKSAKLFPYGYPHGYVSNQMHQYILIFRKQ